MDIIMTEKIGTHINAPKTYNSGDTSLTVDQIDLHNLIHIPGLKRFYFLLKYGFYP